MSSAHALRLVKALHTLAWAFFVGCIVGAPIAASLDQFTIAFALLLCVALEGLVLLANRWRCPLTDIAARYTDERTPNFDIYLPRWLAEHNKAIFTPLYLLGMTWTLYRWMISAT